LFRSTKLWTFYVDLEENLGSMQSTKAAYDQMIKLEVVTPQVIIAYAQYMEENKYFEDSFRVYEKGVQLFEYPHVYPIWLCYLRKFIARYEGTKIERTRDLFEQAVTGVPSAHAHVIYLLYAKFEEDHGLARRAMQVYNRCCTVLEPKDKARMFAIYINRCAEFFGVTKTREIYEAAITQLPEDHLLTMSMRYADLERKLGEIDRARAIYTFASQFADTQTNADFWKLWHDFEVHFGNPQTFQDMLRVSKSVAAQRSQMNLMGSTVKNTPLEEEKKATLKRQREEAVEASGAMAAAEIAIEDRKEAMTQAAAEAKVKVNPEIISAPPTSTPSTSTVSSSNPEEMDIGEDETPELLKEAALVQRAIPDAVFGSGDSSTSGLGALERMRRAKQDA
jgi:pre-mRNA-splicing factor SYF1